MNFIKVILRKINSACKEPKWLLIKPLRFISPMLEDSLYLKIYFYVNLGYKLNLENPKTFNQKLQWLKINYRKPILTKMADKFEAKQFTKEIIGEKYVVKNYGVWNSFEEIDFKKLPEQFVLKTTHDQGGVVVCKNKSKFDKKRAKNILNKHLKSKNYYLTREWPYKNIKPRILAEELLIDEGKEDLWDYKFYCFHGEPKVMYISMGRQGDHVPLYFYDINFNQLDIERPGHKAGVKKIDKPNTWDLMIELAKKVSKDLPHVRVDFYSVGSRVLSGEYTFFQGGGMMPFNPKLWDVKFGEWLDLEKVDIDNTRC